MRHPNAVHQIDARPVEVDAGSVTVSGSISNSTGTAGLTKAGIGVLTNAVNNYNGNTTVNGGTLGIGQATLAIGSIVTVTNGAMLSLGFSATTTNKVTALVLNGVSQPRGVYNATTSPTYLGGTGNLLVLGLATWTGAFSSAWSTNTISSPKNWVGVLGSAVDYSDGNQVVFDDTLTNNSTVNISGTNVTPYSVTFNNNNTNYTVQGSAAIAGSTPLTKNGTGTVTLLNTNTYTGPTTITAGELIGATSGSCSNSALLVMAGTNGVQLATANGQWYCGGLTNLDGSWVDINFNNTPPSTTLAPLVVKGNLAFTNANVMVRGISGTLAPGRYPLIKYTGTLTGTVTPASTNLSTISVGAGAVVTIVNNIANSSIDLYVGGGDNTGFGGVITYTDVNGLNPTNTPYLNGYVVHTFTNTGNNSLYVPNTVTNASVLVVAGGGGGGNGGSSGGGGAGGVIYTNGFTITNGSMTVTVGGGGAPSVAGTNSVIGTLTAIGGGYGANPGAASAGGSGGGAFYSLGTGGSGTAGQGNSGGSCADVTPFPGAGGGGAGGAGGSVTGTGGLGGAGGIGVSNTISGTTNWYGGGGAGGPDSSRVSSVAQVAGGIGGGGASANATLPATNGVANTGGGGGGGANSGSAGNQKGAAGGSGIVIVRYPYTILGPVTWATNSGSWDTTSTNWNSLNLNGVKYVDGFGVIFDDTASGSSPILVTNAVTVSPAGVTVNVTNKNYIISGSAIAGTTALTKYGPGTLILKGTNTYSGNTTVNGGTLLINGNAVGVTNTVTVASGATFGSTNGGFIGGVVGYNQGANAIFAVIPTATGYSNSVYVTFTNTSLFTNTVIHLVLPANLGSGTYVLATNVGAAPTLNGAFTNVIDSGSLASGGSTSVIILGNNLILTVVSGGATPTIIGQTNFVSAFSTTYGTASTAQTYLVRGTNLTANITNTAAPGFEVSGNGGVTYSSTAIVTNVSGNASNTIYIRLAATAAVGTYNSSNIVVLTSTGATSITNRSSASGNVVNAAAPPKFTGISVSGTGLTLVVTNGTPGGPWTLLQSTNLLLPVSQWPTNRTGNYDGLGNLTTNIANLATNRAAFYLLK